MNNFSQNGATIRYTALGTIASGEPVFLGASKDIVGVNNFDVVQDDIGVISICGVYEFEKATEEQLQGALVYWNTGTKKAQVTATEEILGVVAESVIAGDVYVKVYMPLPGSLKAVGTTAADVVTLLESLSGASRVSADAVKDGATNAVLTLVQETKLDNIQLGATTDTDDEIVTLLEALAGAERLSADAIKDGATNIALTLAKGTGYDSFKSKEGDYDALVAAEPQYEILEHEFDISVATDWADAIPVGRTIVGYRFINMTGITATTGVSYKINVTGGATSDLITGIDFVKNTKGTASTSQIAIASVAGVVNLTPNDGTLDTGTVKVGILVRKPLENYEDEA